MFPQKLRCSVASRIRLRLEASLLQRTPASPQKRFSAAPHASADSTLARHQAHSSSVFYLEQGRTHTMHSSLTTSDEYYRRVENIKLAAAIVSTVILLSSASLSSKIFQPQRSTRNTNNISVW